MSTAISLPQLYSFGHPLDMAEDKAGLLRDSSAAAADFDELRRRHAEDGYLYMKDCLDRDEVLAARASLTTRLAAEDQPARPHYRRQAGSHLLNMIVILRHPTKAQDLRGMSQNDRRLNALDHVTASEESPKATILYESRYALDSPDTVSRADFRSEPRKCGQPMRSSFGFSC